MLAFVADAHDVDAPEPLTKELLDRLTELVGCEYATYAEFDWRRRLVTAYVPCSNEGPLEVDLHSISRTVSGPARRPILACPQDRGSTSGPIAWIGVSESVSAMTEEFNAEFRIVDGIGFGVGDLRMRSAWLAFDSQGRDFDERDRELALALRPHVDALWRRSVWRRQAAELLAALERYGDAAEPSSSRAGRADRPRDPRGAAAARRVVRHAQRPPAARARRVARARAPGRPLHRAPQRLRS